MSYIDLQQVLQEWHYDPDRISTRKILGSDGSVKIQLRVELGLLQMEATGRPDGDRPQGYESLLAMFRGQLEEHEERNGTVLGFALTSDDVQELHEEASMYYRRYVASFVLEDFDDVIRDTAHNLAIMDFVREYALDRDDRRRLESFRPYVLMMDARARAYHALHLGESASALAHVNRGLMHIRQFFESINREAAYDNAEEVRILQELREELVSEMPEDSLVLTRNALQAAIEQERFEEAAKLRDQLQGLYAERGLPSPATLAAAGADQPQASEQPRETSEGSC